MKRMMILLVMALVMFTANAFALDTATVTVDAEVMAACTFDTGTLTLDFGALDPDLTTAANATGTLAFTCNNGATYSFFTDAGGDITETGGDTIAYTTSLTGDTSGTSSGGAQLLTVDADIAVGGFTGKTAGNYAGTFTIDLNL
jgi:spore coat protein U-like protein